MQCRKTDTEFRKRKPYYYPTKGMNTVAKYQTTLLLQRADPKRFKK